MGPAESLLAITRNYYKEIKRQNLNPFDLFEWAALRNLWTEIKASGRRGDFTDQTLHRLTKEMIWAALERKAEAYLLEEEDERYQAELDELEHA